MHARASSVGFCEFLFLLVNSVNLELNADWSSECNFTQGTMQSRKSKQMVENMICKGCELVTSMSVCGKVSAHQSQPGYAHQAGKHRAIQL